MVRVLPDGTYLTVVMDSRVRGARREAIVAAAQAGGQDLADHPDSIDVPDRVGDGKR